jgi:hypothetical protein
MKEDLSPGQIQSVSNALCLYVNGKENLTNTYVDKLLQHVECICKKRAIS